MTAKQEEAAVAWTSECIGLLGPTDGIVLHYARRKVQSSTCIPVGMHTEALAPPKPTGINSTNWTWFGSWQTSVPYRSSTFLGRRDLDLGIDRLFAANNDFIVDANEYSLPLSPSLFYHCLFLVSASVMCVSKRTRQPRCRTPTGIVGEDGEENWSGK